MCVALLEGENTVLLQRLFKDQLVFGITFRKLFSGTGVYLGEKLLMMFLGRIIVVSNPLLKPPEGVLDSVEFYI